MSPFLEHLRRDTVDANGRRVTALSESVRRMKEPRGCVFWEKPKRAFDGPLADRFARLETYADDSHCWRYLLECRECGQLYFYEFYEEIDWVQGNDPQYQTLIPLDSEGDAESLKATSQLGLLAYFPRLQRDFPKEAKKPTVRWVR